MNKAAVIPCLVALLFGAASALPADVQVDFLRSTGLGLDGRKGFLSAQDSVDQFVVMADESPVYLLFLWDDKDLVPGLKVTRGGTTVADLDLSTGNKVRLTGGGEFLCTIAARKGTGHWLCVVLSGREWGP
jgi:hypothetical protein